MKLRDGQTVLLFTGSIYSEIVRLSKTGKLWAGICIEAGEGVNATPTGVYTFHQNAVREVL